jgi:Na+/phosphate symporter
MKKNYRLQDYRSEVDKILHHTTQRLSSLSKIYKQKKKEVMSRGEEWHRQIDKIVTSLHLELDNIQKEHESLLQKQEKELEEILRKVDEINTITMKVKKTYNILEFKNYISIIEKQETVSEIAQYSFPVFCKFTLMDHSYIYAIVFWVH